MYSYPSNIPDDVKGCFDGLQKRYIAKYNEIFENTKNEDEAKINAWEEVKKYYYYNDKNSIYLPIKLKAPLKRNYIDIKECPDDVQLLPDEVVKRIWMIQYNNAVGEGKLFKEAKDIAWKAVKNFVFYHIPTCTWKYIRKKNSFAVALQEAMKRKMIERSGKNTELSIQKSRGEEMKDDTINCFEEFKCHIPLQKNEQGMYLFEKTEGGKKEYYLKGEASNTKIDKVNDRVSSSFILKMIKSALGLTVFSEHKHDTEHTVGYISNVEGNENSFIPTTHLESTEENPITKSIVAKTKHGTKLYYSIHGGLTKIATTLIEAGQEIQELIDGYIDEISVVAWPAGEITPLTFAQSLAKSLDEMEKALKHNSKLAESEPSWSSVDKTSLPKAAFAENSGNNKSEWSYPHHHIVDGTEKNDDGIYTNGTMYLHKGGLNAAWAAANGARSGEEASDAIKSHLQTHRKALGMDEKKSLEENGGLKIESLIKAIQTIEDDTTYSLFSTMLMESVYSFKKLITRVINDTALNPENKKEKIADLKSELDSILKSQLKKLFIFIDNNPNQTVW